MRKNISRYVVSTGKFILTGMVLIFFGLALLAGLYFISEPFNAFAYWYRDNNIAPKAFTLVVMPVLAAYASQIKENLSEQAKRLECKSTRLAFTETDRQIPQVVMGWLTWFAFALGAIALLQIVKSI